MLFTETTLHQLAEMLAERFPERGEKILMCKCTVMYSETDVYAYCLHCGGGFEVIFDAANH